MRETRGSCLTNTYRALSHLLCYFFTIYESYLNLMGCWHLSELSRSEAGEGKISVAQTLEKNILFHSQKKEVRSEHTRAPE